MKNTITVWSDPWKHMGRLRQLKGYTWKLKLWANIILRSSLLRSPTPSLSVMVARSLAFVVVIDRFAADIAKRLNHNIRFAPDAAAVFPVLSASPLRSSPPDDPHSGSGFCPSADIPAYLPRRRPRRVRSQTYSPRHHNRLSSPGAFSSSLATSTKIGFHDP